MTVFYRQIIPISLCYILVFLYLRQFIAGAITYQLNLSARKKRRANQTFKEWILYTRYRNEIPNLFLIWYFYYSLAASHCVDGLLAAAAHRDHSAVWNETYKRCFVFRRYMGRYIEVPLLEH